MKYEVILNDKEIEEILNLNLNMEDRINWFKNKYDVNKVKENKKTRFVFSIIQGCKINGNIQNNPKDLRCPNCKGKYVVRTYAGDLYCRVIAGTEKQKQVENKKLEKIGLHSNPWAIKGDFTREYQCLNCGIRWDGLSKNIYRDFK